ncbi:MAG: hypothetical protein ACJ8FY_07535 [Gemmataceae bacterium]
MALLSHEQYLATFGDTRSRISSDEPVPFDFWPYFETIPPADFEGHDCSATLVEYVWREGSGRFEHVLINSEDPNVFMVVILDRKEGTVYGHRLLDLNKEYGLHT